ncbi:MAG TPA: VIT domain-containing protein [Tepidisphaeraceae bacterium]|nr:VIT domain-containing protein [Tepidisphaeraceae bacterium]
MTLRPRPIALPIALFLSALLSLLLAPFALADGLIIIRNGPVVPGHFAFAPLEVTYHHVDVRIDDQVATTSVDEEFYNPNGQRLEGEYIFPLPAGSHIDNFSMDVNGQMMTAELLPADKAKQLYEDIVRQMRDPALLEYTGRDALKVHIFPIEPNSRKHVQLKYTQLLSSDAGVVEYSYPLNTEKFSSRPLNDVSVRVTLACKQPIKSIYSPSHNVDISRHGDRDATVGYEAKDVRPDMDFRLIFSRKQTPLGIDLMTYKLGSSDGYFMVLASPGADDPGKTVTIPKDVCFVLDTSGSMAGPKLEQAKKAMNFCLANLNPEDRFEVIRFSTEPEALFNGLEPVNGENSSKARAFVENLKAIGGTAIDEALRKALELRRPQNVARDQYSEAMIKEDGRPFVVIFLTDGLPTVGETREDPIVAHASQEAQSRKGRVFCFGIGNDVNTHLLDRIAGDTRAASQYVGPEEDIEVKVSNFYSKIKEPAMTDVQLAVTGSNVRTSQLYPNVMPDLFKGQMLVAFGRYSGDGAAAVKVSGIVNGAHVEFAQDVTFATENINNAFIPRLWAARRVGWLLDEIRLHGESPELKDEVTRLAREHGIVTPYTAYLIMEDERKRSVPLSLQSYREMSTDTAAAGAGKVYFDSMDDEAKKESSRSGRQAVANAGNLAQLKDSQNLSQSTVEAPMQKTPTAGGGGFGYRNTTNYAQQVRVMNGRAFYQNGNTWSDGTAQSQQNLKQKKIAFNSDEYFDLLKQHPEAVSWLSLGNEVDVVLDDTLIMVR